MPYRDLNLVFRPFVRMFAVLLDARIVAHGKPPSAAPTTARAAASGQVRARYLESISALTVRPGYDL